jgi:dTDP-4-amino-4,6-dideoxygalactose transaminase
VRVPLFDPEATLGPLRERLAARAAEVLASGTYVLGPELRAFEGELAAQLGARHAIGVGNGTDAITLALRALGVGPGDEVVVPSFTFYASAEAIPPTGAAPVFCDIDLDTFCVTAETVNAALTPRTKAIVAVDLFGNPAPIADIAELGVPVVEDAAQAAGASLRGRAAGALGTLGTLSFYPSKNLGGFGDGGAVITDDDELADAVRMLRTHGSRDRRTYERIGVNSRLDELQAALLRVLLPHLDEWSAGRRAAADHYARAGLADVVRPPAPVAGAEPAWHLYVVRHARAGELAPAGIETRAYYRTPVHAQAAMRPWPPRVPLPATAEAARTHLAIPISPTLTAATAATVVAALRSAVDDRSSASATR